MEPLLMILIPGIFGGLVLALFLARNWGRRPSIVVPRRLEAASPSLINMAHIRVEGIGGLGMVAAVAVVAIADPRIGLATIVALVLGVGLALLLIAMRRKSGALPSSGEGPDDRSMLHIDGDRGSTHPAGVRTTIDEVKRAGVAVA
jgi:hypothetical protein